ncbi:hypothetical protein BDR06DRAFT_828599, partial [Suillus hirtellus]
IADGLSRQWEGHQRDIGLLDGSEWTVSEDWEFNSGLVNNLLQISTNVDTSTASQLQQRFSNEPVFLEVIEAMLQMDQRREVRERKRARHRASQYLIDNRKLWRLRGGTAVRARSRVECVTRAEAQALAAKQHDEGGHWGRDAIKIALTDRIHSPKLDASIMNAI